jgi:type I restriction enzyme S subunit
MSEVVLKDKTLPLGWEEASIGQIATISTGKRDANHAESNGAYTFFTCAFEPLKADTFAFDDEALLLPGNGHNVGEVFYYKGKFEAYQRTYVIHEIKVLPKYLFYHLKYGWRKATDQKQYGTATNYIRIGNFHDYRFPVAPTEQQKRIVAKIEELFSHIDAGIASLKKAKQLLKQYRQSVLKAAVTGELTKQWREDNKDKLEPSSQLIERILQERRKKWEAQQLEQFKAKGKVPKDDGWKGKYKEPGEVVLAELPELPEEWIWARLDSIAFVGTGMSVSKSRKVIDPVDVAYLRVANVQRGYLVLDKMKKMPIEKDKLSDLELQEWDVLYNEGGDIDKLGRGWIWENQVKPCITQNHVFRASPYIKERSHSVFLSIWGNTFGQDYFIDTGKQTTNLASINKGVLSAFPTPLPPIEEQKTIIDIVEEKLASITRLEVEVNNQLIKAEKNKQSILASAFSGGLVEALDSDGSAQELLERIKQQYVLNAAKEKLGSIRKSAKKKDKPMEKKKIIAVLKTAEKALPPETLFDLIGADGSSPDEIEGFYIELKEALSDKNVVVETVLDKGVKKGDLISYKVEV